MSAELRSTKKFQSAFRWFGLTLGLLIYTALFSEGFLRLWSPQPILPRDVEAAPWGVRRNKPNATYWQTTPEVSVQIRINSQGMRDDRTFPLSKPPKTCRIGLFGDSYFMGFELAINDTFAAKLESKLRAAGYRVEVLNFAVSGFGTAEMLRAYEGQARAFGLDLGLFSFVADDYEDNVRSGLYRLEDGVAMPTNKAYLPAAGVRRLLSNPIYHWISDNSQFYSLLRERLSYHIKRIAASLAMSLQADDADDSFSTKLTTALLLEAEAEFHQNSAGFALVEIPIRPTRNTRTDYWSSLARLPADIGKKMLIISPLAAFRAAANPNLKLYYEQGQGHLTPDGTEILANITVDAITKSAEFKPCLLAEQ